MIRINFIYKFKIVFFDSLWQNISNKKNFCSLNNLFLLMQWLYVKLNQVYTHVLTLRSFLHFYGESPLDVISCVHYFSFTFFSLSFDEIIFLFHITVDHYYSYDWLIWVSQIEFSDGGITCCINTLFKFDSIASCKCIMLFNALNRETLKTSAKLTRTKKNQLK